MPTLCLTEGVKLFSLGGAVIASYGLSDTGCVRPENEDRILVDDALGLFIVADGMGGHSYGEVAAELATSVIRKYINSSRNPADVTWPFGYSSGLSPNQNRLSTALQLANRRVWEHSEQTPELAGMGTTVAAVLISKDAASIASVGDSRVYLFRDHDLQPLTVDDTWVGAMVRQGSLDASEVARHPMRNVLTQAAGARSSVQVQTIEHKLRDGDLLLISSDGLHGVVDEAVMRSILAEAARPGASLERCAHRLVDAVLDRGAPDNISCILLRYL